MTPSTSPRQRVSYRAMQGRSQSQPPKLPPLRAGTWCRQKINGDGELLFLLRVRMGVALVEGEDGARFEHPAANLRAVRV